MDQERLRLRQKGTMYEMYLKSMACGPMCSLPASPSLAAAYLKEQRSSTKKATGLAQIPFMRFHQKGSHQGVEELKLKYLRNLTKCDTCLYNICKHNDKT